GESANRTGTEVAQREAAPKREGDPICHIHTAQDIFCAIARRQRPSFTQPMTTPLTSPRFLILADGDFGPMLSKTANSVIRYRPDRVVGVLDRVEAGKTAGEVLGFGGAIPVVGSMAEGLALGPEAVLIGIAPQGGRLPEEWRAWLAEAIEAGCDIWSGLHTFLADDPMLAELAQKKGTKLLDLRRPPPDLPIASGAAKQTAALRVLAVGTDCNVGKMTAQLQLVRSLNE